MTPHEMRMRVLACLELAVAEPERMADLVVELHDEIVKRDEQPIDAGDVVYVRHGAHSSRLAAVLGLGVGVDEGFVLVRAWSDQAARLQRMKRIPTRDVLGFPENDPRAHVVRRALETHLRDQAEKGK